MNRNQWIASVAVTIALLGGGIAYIQYTHNFLAMDLAHEAKQWQKHDEKSTELSAELKQAAAKIPPLAGDRKCYQSSDCRVVGIGRKACGRFSQFLVYSEIDAEETELLIAVQKFNDLSETLNSISLAAASCGKKAPAVTCVEHICR